MTDFHLSLGGVILHIQSKVDLAMGEALRTFLVPQQSADCDVTVGTDFDAVTLPAQKCGSDLLLDYYRTPDCCYAVARPGTSGSAVCTAYTPDLTHAEVFLNEREYPDLLRTAEKVLQLFPIRELLTLHGVLMLHSSRVSVQGSAILFTAPSGTGKTTQANLWHDCADAEVLCNDRTLIVSSAGGSSTCGYPVDGSSPVCSSVSCPLGALVVLRQGRENTVSRLSAARALSLLMSQTVTDVWNGAEISAQQQLWLDVLQTCPVYLLSCTPDRNAVECLKNRLCKDGVLCAD